MATASGGARHGKRRRGEIDSVVVTVASPADRQTVMDVVKLNKAGTGLGINEGHDPRQILIIFTNPNARDVVEFRKWVGQLEKVEKVESSTDWVSRFSLKPETKLLAKQALKTSVRTFIGAFFGVPGSEAAGGRTVTITTFTYDALIAAAIAALVAGATVLVKD